MQTTKEIFVQACAEGRVRLECEIKLHYPVTDEQIEHLENQYKDFDMFRLDYKSVNIISEIKNNISDELINKFISSINRVIDTERKNKSKYNKTFRRIAEKAKLRIPNVSVTKDV